MRYQYAAFFALASAQGFGGPGRGGPPNTYPGLPSCLSSCFTSNSACSYGDISCYCNSTSISSINSCISGSSCSSSDKEGAYQAIAQLCVNAGASVTASPEATFSATSGGSAWPTQWTTDGYYASAWSSWKSQSTGGPGPFGGQWGAWSSSSGWTTASNWGPFGAGNDNGWGPYGSGAWTSGGGPWTKWWGSNACPPSTWSGWTEGSWSATPSWTAWTACTATTTATSVITTTVTSSGHTSAVTSTSFGVKVDQASVTGSTTTPNGAMITNYGVAGAAAGAIGILAGAIML